MADQSLNTILRASIEANPSTTALRFGEQHWTYAELDQVADWVAAGLRGLGIGRGDRVAFLLPNEPEVVFLDLACLKLGAIAVPMNVRMKGPELAYVLGHSRARVCVVQADLYPGLASVRRELTGVERFFIVGGGNQDPGCDPFDALLAEGRDIWEPTEPDAVATILYTSGTTARPKGVTHTQRSLAATVDNYTQASRMRADDIVLGMLSMSHIFGFTLQLLSPLSVGAVVIVSPNFDADRVLNRVLNLVTNQRVTHLYGLPVMFDALTRPNADTTFDLSSLRYCLAGGDSVSPQLSARLRDRLGIELHEGCGMTEVIPYALNRPGMENRVGSIGPPSVGMNLRIVDELGRDAPDGAVGEIVVQSDGLTVGYWEDPAATAEAMRDGWFHTGDLGRRDEAGYYWFVGRSKEIIVRGGSNIAPLEVEAALAQHPAVLEVAVVGVPHPTLGETVAAFVVVKPGAVASAGELREFVGERIAAYKVPETIAFLADLPRGATGKVHRKSLAGRRPVEHPTL